MEYDRFKSSQQRPFGSGAFFDFASAVTRLHAQNLEALRARMGSKQPRAVPQREPDPEQRWDGEGGNSQTRIARRAERYER